jgi:hypothetical protein
LSTSQTQSNGSCSPFAGFILEHKQQFNEQFVCSGTPVKQHYCYILAVLDQSTTNQPLRKMATDQIMICMPPEAKSSAKHMTAAYCTTLCPKQSTNQHATRFNGKTPPPGHALQGHGLSKVKFAAA